jgi:Transposase, Mutator family
VDLVGPNGLLNQLTKSVLETALEAEMGEHLGYDKHEVAGRTGGNSRNGTRAKTGQSLAASESLDQGDDVISRWPSPSQNWWRPRGDARQ